MVVALEYRDKKSFSILLLETQDQATVLETFNQEVALMSDISRHDFFVKVKVS